MRALPAKHTPPHHTLRILHWNFSSASFQEHDCRDHADHPSKEHNQPKSRQLTNFEQLVRFHYCVRQARHDPCKNDQRDAVANTSLGDLLAQPHEKRSAGRQSQYRHQTESPSGGLHKSPAIHVFQPDGDAERLDQSNPDRSESGVLNNLLPPALSFLGQFRQVRDHHRQQLENDRRADIRHDAERENRQPRKGPSGKDIKEAKQRTAFLQQKLR